MKYLIIYFLLALCSCSNTDQTRIIDIDSEGTTLKDSAGYYVIEHIDPEITANDTIENGQINKYYYDRSESIWVQIDEPATPPSNNNTIYKKQNDSLYFKDDEGKEYDLKLIGHNENYEIRFVEHDTANWNFSGISISYNTIEPRPQVDVTWKGNLIFRSDSATILICTDSLNTIQYLLNMMLSYHKSFNQINNK